MHITVVKKTTDIKYRFIEGVLDNPIPVGIFNVEIGTEDWWGLTVTDPPSATALAFSLERQWIFFLPTKGT